jgi:tRNA-(ms[2]io[6]A)-hydroxylase
MSESALEKQVLAVRRFLRCPTPAAWFAAARDNLDLLLIDHANCEKKAAGNALSLLYRHVENGPLLQRLSRLAREELRHFEQVHDLMTSLGISYRVLTAARYAGALRALAAPREPERLVDHLVVSAIVEARSCERFAGLVEVLPERVAELYRGLLASEARHFMAYLDAARAISAVRVEACLPELLRHEAELIQSPDAEFRFHSGPPREGQAL